MVIGVLAEISELIKGAETQHLSQQQEQPINFPFLSVQKGWFGAIFSSAIHTFEHHRIHPRRRGSIMHGPSFFPNEFAQLVHFLLQIKRHLELIPAPPALNPSGDGDNIVLQ